MKLGQLAEQLSCAVEGNADVEIRGLASIQQAGPGELSFIEGDKHIRLIKGTRAEALILHPKIPDPGLPCLRTENPRLVFARALALFYQPRRPRPGIHPTAVIGQNVRIDSTAYLGPHVVVGDDTVIEAGVIIHPNCTLYEGVRVGAHTVIHANCAIHERTEIGAECILQSGVVLGGEGFGFVPMADGSWHKMPQSGHVVVGDGVEVGANTTIDRPAVGSTEIGCGTKIDNLVMVGHGCSTGEHCLLVSQVGLAGGARLGRNVMLAGQVGVADHVTIGDRAVATAQSGIPSDIEAGTLVSGYPAMPHSIFLRVAAIYRRLPELYAAVRELQRKVSALQHRAD